MYKTTSTFMNRTGLGRKASDESDKRYQVVTYHLQRVHNKKTCTPDQTAVIRRTVKKEPVTLREAERLLETRRFGYAEIFVKEESAWKLKKEVGDPSLKSKYDTLQASS